ncbi:MAG: EamA family transporter [Antricoccus sp.]
MSTSRRPVITSGRAPLIFIVGAIAQYLGAALAVRMFSDLNPAAVAWIRVVVAAVVLMIICRPRWWRWTRRRLITAAIFGVVTLAMNIAFYEAIARLPLGTAVAMEFIGPITVAAVGSRGQRDLIGLALATGGVLLLADISWEGQPLGVIFALVAALMWASYIVLGKHVADDSGGADGLAIGLAAASLIGSPMVLMSGPLWHSWTLIVLAIGVGVLSGAVPYGLDQIVLRRMGRDGFALLLAILPATAALVGFVVLGQVLSRPELLGVAMVIAAVWLSKSRWHRADSAHRSAVAED